MMYRLELSLSALHRVLSALILALKWIEGSRRRPGEIHLIGQGGCSSHVRTRPR